MTTPRIESIAANINTRINAITTLSGFNYTLTCIRPTAQLLAELPTTHLQARLEQTNIDTDEQAFNTSTKNASFVLMVPLFISITSTDVFDTICNKVACDIEKKLLSDVTCGGYAINVTISKISFADIDGIPAVAVEFTVKYRHKYGDPYTA